MTEYICLIFLILIEGLYFQNKKINKDFYLKVYTILLFFQFVFIVGARAPSIGADTQTYLSGYQYYYNLSGVSMFSQPAPWYIDYELGYMILMKIAAFLNFPPPAFLFLIAALTYLPICSFYFKYSDNICISIICFIGLGLFGYTLGVIRQMLSIGILLYSITFIRQRKIIKFIVTIGIAMSFHLTAIIFLPMYWISNIKFKNIYFFIFLIAEIFFFFCSDFLISLCLRIFPSYTSYINSKWGGIGGSYRFLILLNFSIFTCVIFRNKIAPTKKKFFDFCIYSLMIASLLQILAYRFVVMGRVNCCFLPFLGIAFSSIVSSALTAKEKICITSIIVIFFMSFFFYTTISTDYIYPYEFFWQ